MSTPSDVSERNLKPAPQAKKRKVRVWEHSRGVRQTVKQGWSWPAFIFGIFWFGYKKIWITTVMIAAGASVVAGVAIAAGASLDAEMGILLPILALAHVVFGMLGNRIWERDLVDRNYRSINRPPRTIQQSGDNLNLNDYDRDIGIGIGNGSGSTNGNDSIALSPQVNNDSERAASRSISVSDLISENSENIDRTAITDPEKAPTEFTPVSDETHKLDRSRHEADDNSPTLLPLNQQPRSPQHSLRDTDSSRPESQPRVKIPSSKSSDKQQAPATAMSMQELEAMFGVTPTPAPATAEHATQSAANSIRPQGAVERVHEHGHDIDANSHPSSETASMLGIETNTQIEKYETIAWMEITSGNVEPELWDAVNVESDDEDSAQNNYVVRRVSQLQIQQGDVIERNAEENQISNAASEATITYDDAHSVQANSDAEDIHSGFISNGEEYSPPADSFAANGVAQSTDTSQSGSPEAIVTSAASPAASPETDDESGLNFNHVKHVIIPDSTNNPGARTQSNHSDDRPNQDSTTKDSTTKDATTQLLANEVDNDGGNETDRLVTESIAVNRNHHRNHPSIDSEHASNGHANGTGQTLNGIENSRMANLSRDGHTSDVLSNNTTNSAAIVSAIAGDVRHTTSSDSNAIGNYANGKKDAGDNDTGHGAPEHDRRRNALNFIQDHLQRLDDQQQEISTPELKRLLWSADCELIDHEDSLKIKDWDGNLIPSASRSSISRTISYLIWTHYSDSREQL